MSLNNSSTIFGNTYTYLRGGNSREILKGGYLIIKNQIVNPKINYLDQFKIVIVFDKIFAILHKNISNKTILTFNNNQNLNNSNLYNLNISNSPSITINSFLDLSNFF